MSFDLLPCFVEQTAMSLVHLCRRCCEIIKPYDLWLLTFKLAEITKLNFLHRHVLWRDFDTGLISRLHCDLDTCLVDCSQGEQAIILVLLLWIELNVLRWFFDNLCLHHLLRPVKLFFFIGLFDLIEVQILAITRYRDFNTFFCFFLCEFVPFTATADAWLIHVGALDPSVNVNRSSTDDHSQVDDRWDSEEIDDVLAYFYPVLRTHLQVLHWQNEIGSEETHELIEASQYVELHLVKGTYDDCEREREEV